MSVPLGTLCAVEVIINNYTRSESMNNICLRFTCPHCFFEYVTAGVDIDRVQSCICPKCGAYCEITVMTNQEMVAWINTNIEVIGDV